MTNRFDELEDILAELRRRHRQREAPARLAAVLSTATYASQSQLRRSKGWRVWAAAAAILVAVVAWRADRRHLETNAAAMRGPAVAAWNEPATEFVALPESAGLPPPIATTILQLRLRKSELRRYGFDVPPSSDAELVRADFVIGDDGLARAVRFVH